MRSNTKHILLGAVMAIALFCSLGFYDVERFTDSTVHYFGTDNDVSWQFDGTNLELFAAAADTPWAIGGTSYGFDITYSFETEGTIAIDYDGDSIALSDTISLVIGSDSDWTISCGVTKILQLTPVGDETYGVYIGADTAGADFKLFGAVTTDHLTYDASVGTLTMQSTSDSTASTTSIKPIYLKSILAGVNGAGGRAEFHTYTNVALGQWCQALKGYMQFDTGGSVAGLGSAITAEVKFPGELIVGGTYAGLDIQLVTTENGDHTSTTDCFQWMQISGNSTATLSWEESAYLFIIKGLTDTLGSIFDVNSTPTCDATLRILVGTTPYYILLSDSPTS